MAAPSASHAAAKAQAVCQPVIGSCFPGAGEGQRNYSAVGNLANGVSRHCLAAAPVVGVAAAVAKSTLFAALLVQRALVQLLLLLRATRAVAAGASLAAAGVGSAAAVARRVRRCHLRRSGSVQVVEATAAHGVKPHQENVGPDGTAVAPPAEEK